jgi:hypothetical protein
LDVAEPLRIDRVRIAIGDETVELSWAIAQELQARMLRFKATAPLVDQFGRAGTTRPVILRPNEAGPLLVVVSQWAKETGLERLPAGISDLLDRLSDRRS